MGLVDFLDEALSLINKACSYPCMREMCERFSTLVRVAGESLAATEFHMLKPTVTILIGYLESALEDALRNGCVEAASSLSSAITRLRIIEALMV